MSTLLGLANRIQFSAIEMANISDSCNCNYGTINATPTLFSSDSDVCVFTFIIDVHFIHTFHFISFK